MKTAAAKHKKNKNYNIDATKAMLNNMFIAENV